MESIKEKMKLSDIGMRTRSTRDVMRQVEDADHETDTHNLMRALEYIDVLESVVTDLREDVRDLEQRRSETDTFVRAVLDSRQKSQRFARAWKALAKRLREGNSLPCPVTHNSLNRARQPPNSSKR